jgi:putative ABC transport system substrate-binding protein
MMGWPLRLRAQQHEVPTIGFLNAGSAKRGAREVVAFREGLKEAGFVDGRDAIIEYRWADGSYERLPAMALDLVERKVAVIVANTSAVVPAKAATGTIPIVFETGVDPVAAGLVPSLSRPGGNLTGVTSFARGLGVKQLELLRELLPTTTNIAMLVNPNSLASRAQANGLQAAADALRLKLHILYADSERDFDSVFAKMVELRVGALLIGGDALLVSRSQELAELALRHALPAIFLYREFASAGGLISYGRSREESYRLVGVYVGRILKGEKPADLPVQQATKLELIINVKTAKTLGITIPPALLSRADEVIE